MLLVDLFDAYVDKKISERCGIVQARQTHKVPTFRYSPKSGKRPPSDEMLEGDISQTTRTNQLKFLGACLIVERYLHEKYQAKLKTWLDT